jgi:DNA damage-binding protein 1
MDVRGDTVIVGDLMTSASLYTLSGGDAGGGGGGGGGADGGAAGNAAGREILEIARDWNQSWTTAVHFVDDDHFLVAENSHNIFALERNSSAAADEDRRRLVRTALFHTGAYINRIRAGSLVMRVPEADPGVLTSHVYGTADGGVGVIARLTDERFAFFSRVERAVEQLVPGVGGLPHEVWRAYVSDNAVPRPAVGFVDGDIVESFLGLPRDTAEAVARIVGAPYDQIVQSVEEISRIH